MKPIATFAVVGTLMLLSFAAGAQVQRYVDRSPEPIPGRYMCLDQEMEHETCDLVCPHQAAEIDGDCPGGEPMVCDGSFESKPNQGVSP
ncbi:MAG TPA: hypothetical protein VMS08_03405 [Candidatus Saccharimonadia bacterium]|nr:hypothetical protein [Candidatus Saccharimonadia bacterium]